MFKHFDLLTIFGISLSGLAINIKKKLVKLITRGNKGIKNPEKYMIKFKIQCMRLVKHCSNSYEKQILSIPFSIIELR